MPGLRVLHVASELLPLVKTGGLADVARDLPAALRRAGHDARVCVPGYRAAVRSAEKLGISWLPNPMIIEASGVDHRVGIGRVEVDGVPVYLLDCDELYGREGIYGPTPGNDYDDNARRYSVFCKAALALPGALGWIPHVLHAHDWQAGLAPVLLERGFGEALPATRSVFTIHNIAFQGAFPPADMRLSGLDPALFNEFQVGHGGRFNFLKAGVVFADRVTTVSRRYAEELQTPEFAYGMDAVMRGCAYKLRGITNGIDTTSWDPGGDKLVAARYSAKDLAGKAVCKQALRRECLLHEDPRACVMGVVSRLTEQKGIDLIAEAVEPYILDGRLQLVVLGAGDLALEHRLHLLQAKHPGRVFVWYGYNEALAHRIIAGSDAFLMPSRFEPCGLTQMYSLRYGTLPIVRWTGGLADTVRDVATGDGNGFSFGPIDIGHFSSVIDRALGLYEHFPAEWRAAMLRAMAADNSWDHAARAYVDLYTRISIA